MDYSRKESWTVELLEKTQCEANMGVLIRPPKELLEWTAAAAGLRS